MRGFTLLELVLVIALAALLAVAVIPRFTPSPSGIDAASRKIESDILYAQSLAMSRGVNHGINFVSGGSYVLYRGSVGIPILDPLTRQNFSEDLIRFGRTEVANNFLLEFDPMGQPVLGGGGGGLTLVNGSQTRRLAISPNTGHITVIP